MHKNKESKSYSYLSVVQFIWISLFTAKDLTMMLRKKPHGFAINLPFNFLVEPFQYLQTH